MIQVGTYLKIVDNTGGKLAQCIKIKPGYRKRYAKVTDMILVSVKSVRSKRRETLKVKPGELYKAIIVRLKSSAFSFSGDFSNYLGPPSIILLNKKNKIFGTKIFGAISNKFRHTTYLKSITLSAGYTSFL